MSEQFVLVHKATGDEYVFTSRSEYVNTLASGGYTEKDAEGSDDSTSPVHQRQDPPRRSVPPQVPGTPQARPVPVEQQD